MKNQPTLVVILVSISSMDQIDQFTNSLYSTGLFVKKQKKKLLGNNYIKK